MNKSSGDDLATMLTATARRVLPGGTFGNMEDGLIIREGRGARVWDVAGREFIDYLIGSGPMFLGHNQPYVREAVEKQIERGTTFFADNEYGIRLASEIVEAVPCAEQVRFLSAGTEAVAYALRLARAYRGRDKILKFEGGYHGMSDAVMMSVTPGRLANFPNAVPESPGIPASVARETIVAPFNDAQLAAELIREHRDELACVIVEPLQRLLPPQPGFLETLREVTAETGVLLIFDEIVTGFRLAYGGAQAYYGVTPDICTLGKILGGGFPLAAVAGRAEIMALFDRQKVGADRFLMQMGTLSGNPVAAVAGLATLELLKRPGVYDGVFANGRSLMRGLERQLNEAGVDGRVVGEPIMFDVLFSNETVRDYRGLQRADAAMHRRVNRRMRQNGILKADGKYYVSVALSNVDIAETIEAFGKALSDE